MRAAQTLSRTQDELWRVAEDRAASAVEAACLSHFPRVKAYAASHTALPLSRLNVAPTAALALRRHHC